jgi:tetratricopeptide (TPR) repeat protein
LDKLPCTLAHAAVNLQITVGPSVLSHSKDNQWTITIICWNPARLFLAGRIDLKKRVIHVCSIAVLGILSLCVVVRSAAHSLQGSLTPADLVKQGDYLYQQGKFREAVEYYKMAVEREPYNDHALGYIGYAYHKLNDKPNARTWMKRRADAPALSPSIRAQVLTDVTLLYWDDADAEIQSRLANSSDNKLKPGEVDSVRKLVAEGIDNAQKVVAIAPRSIKAFNLLNLLYRANASLDPSSRGDLVKADEALRRALSIVQSNPQGQPATDIFAVPTVSIAPGVDPGSAIKLGNVTTKAQLDSVDEVIQGSAVIEVFVGPDGLVKLTRLVKGEGKLGQAASAAARKYQFEPSTFEGQPIQVVRVISFPDKP